MQSSGNGLRVDRLQTEWAAASVRYLLLARAARGAPGVDLTPLADAVDEFPAQVDLQKPFDALRAEGRHLLGAEVYDLERRLDLNTVGPLALANLLGTTTRLSGLHAADADRLTVERADRLPPQGFVLVDRELIGYGRVEGNVLRDLRRGLLAEAGLELAHELHDGSLVLDYRVLLVVQWTFDRPGLERRKRVPYSGARACAPRRTGLRRVHGLRGLPEPAPIARDLCFVVLYKLSDNLTKSLTGPFLVQIGFGDVDVGVARTTIGQAAAIAGTFVGGVLTDRMGLGRSLWVFGFLQLASNLGYAAVAEIGVNRPVMYAAQAFEHVSSGLGSGAFGVLLLRLTQKRFSATQYALLSSLFTLPRVLTGPVTGVLADAMGWRDFFVLTVVFRVPGLLMLARFVPWNARDVEFEVEAPPRGSRLSRAGVPY